MTTSTDQYTSTTRSAPLRVRFTSAGVKRARRAPQGAWAARLGGRALKVSDQLTVSEAVTLSSSAAPTLEVTRPDGAQLSFELSAQGSRAAQAGARSSSADDQSTTQPSTQRRSKKGKGEPSPVKA